MPSTDLEKELRAYELRSAITVKPAVFQELLSREFNGISRLAPPPREIRFVKHRLDALWLYLIDGNKDKSEVPASAGRKLIATVRIKELAEIITSFVSGGLTDIRAIKLQSDVYDIYVMI